MTERRIATIVGLTGDTTVGQSLYTMQCSSCHDGLGGAVSSRGAQIRFTVPARSDESILTTLIDGRMCGRTMPSFAALDDQQLADVLALLRRDFTDTSQPPEADSCRVVDAGTRD